MKHHYIAIEGPIGVGKSTLAKALSSAFKADYLRDTDGTNPYLKAFYKDPKTVALHTQLHFLTSRMGLLRSPEFTRAPGPVVTDFSMDKNRLFAELTLSEQEWWMYSRLHEQMVADAPTPDLVIYLQAPLEVLLRRIERRGIRHEIRMDSHYLQRLITSYDRFFHDYANSPLLIVNASDINIGDDPEDTKRLIERVRQLDGGRHYYNPAPSAKL